MHKTKTLDTQVSAGTDALEAPPRTEHLSAAGSCWERENHSLLSFKNVAAGRFPRLWWRATPTTHIRAALTELSGGQKTKEDMNLGWDYVEGGRELEGSGR